MRFRWIVCFAIFAAVIIGAAYFYRNQQLSAGQKAYENHDYALAIEKLAPFAGWRDPQAESELGIIYLNGYGVPKNYFLAFDLFKKSAAAGFPHGEYFLGYSYDYGEGAAVDLSKAIYWYQMAANQGDSEAEYALGLHYSSGKGVPIDLAEAASWYQKAAEQGQVDAQSNLGVAYKDGDGVPQDYAQAADMFQKAADQGNADGQNNLGTLYHDGQGVPQDYTQAAYWFGKAAAQGQATGQYNLALLYQTGQGVPQDDNEAISLLTKSAGQGYAAAQFELGAAYYNGEGVTSDQAEAADLFQKAAVQGDESAEDALGQLYEVGFINKNESETYENDVFAYMLFDLSAAQGFSAAKSSKESLAQHLTPEQILSAQRLSETWQIGSPLPTNFSYEDLAPQLLFNSGSTTPDTYAASRIWFSRTFPTKNGPRYVVFIVTTGDTDHAASANISAVTFDPSEGQDGLFNGQAQLNFTQLGSYGDVLPLDDPQAPYASPKRIGVSTYNLNNGRVALLVPDGYSGMGEIDFGYEIFAFDVNENYQSGQWEDIGGITTADDTTGNCPSGSPPLENIPCYSWKGTVEMLPAKEGDWPEFAVHPQGTALDANNKLIAAPEMIYGYNGQKYVQVQPSAVGQ